MEVCEKVKKLIETIILENGYLLDNVLYVKEDGMNFLRIIIDKKEGFIDIEDCISVTKLINPILEQNFMY